MKAVAIVMGSKSDLPVVEPAIERLKSLGIPCCVRVLSAHRTPEEAANFAKTAADRGIGVICCAAGKAAHLAGSMAAQTVLPVIGIPVKASALEGMDALLSTVQMPAGIPVATVAINGADNAAILAAQILAVADPALTEKLLLLRNSMAQAVLAQDAQMQETYPLG
ncbi:MAG: 5-(carboxyamino)imidazole ribonucleotide mutase [Eubacteriales bacterium]|nr:5-(carboxyamino)imidazole ribonucleotide mutase [Eubacteriales bacterium]